MTPGEARIALILFGLVLSGCELPTDGTNPEPPTEPAQYLGAVACGACHSNVYALHAIHGHSQVVKPIEGAAPTYPAEAGAAGVPNPPAGVAWTGVSYVIGGYTKSANFLDTAGFLLTDGLLGTQSQYVLRQDHAGVQEGFVPYLPDQGSPLPYSYNCFRCHATGAESAATNGARRQDNRPGIGGTWVEAGVQCEACHGPGSLHVPDPAAGNIILAGAADSCRNCHVSAETPDVLAAKDGFIVGGQQYTEVEASPHAGFACTVCHNPHASILYDRADGMRNECQDCHTDFDSGFHTGRVFIHGDHVENLSCESCHMPFAARYSTAATPEFTDGRGRVGDTRSHLMYIDNLPRDFSAMFSADGRQVITDSSGKAAVTLDFVCLRCHNGEGNAFPLDLEGVSAITDRIHNPG